MKSLKMFWMIVANEFAARCCTSTTHDIETVMSRSESEGSSFLTITLPAFGKDFEKSLDQGQIPLGSFCGWKVARGSRTPLFLGGFLDLIFDRVSGRLLDEPNLDAILAIRQLTLMYGKILLPCSDERRENAIKGYIECEQEVRRSDAERATSLEEEFRKASLVLWGTVLQAVDEDVYYGRIVPRHGPGITADRLMGNHKFDQSEWTERLDRVFPAGDFILPSPRYHQEYLPSVHFLEPGAERPVKVITVPKTLKTPRIIAVEPTCMQYAQQGLMRKFVEYIESPSIGVSNNHNRGFGVVGFTDQYPNQVLAQEGSLNGELATLDLSEASDRVSNQLVRLLLDNFPNVAEGVDASRSRTADVPGHGLIRLAKFASMGSALTFPIEAMVFSTICFIGIAHGLSRSVDAELIHEFRSQVRVYGDDIIVPVRFVHPVLQSLEAFGFKVNQNKSFWTGKFRESCGKEYYDGEDVSVHRVRREFPSGRGHVAEIVSMQSLRNDMYMSGLWNAAKYLDEILSRVLGGHYPVLRSYASAADSGGHRAGAVSSTERTLQRGASGMASQGSTPGDAMGRRFVGRRSDEPHSRSLIIGRVSVAFGYRSARWHPTLHAPMVKGWVVSNNIPASVLDGVGAMVKCLLNQGEEPFADNRHLLRAGRPDAVRIKLGWRQPF